MEGKGYLCYVEGLYVFWVLGFFVRVQGVCVFVFRICGFTGYYFFQFDF